MLSQPLSESDAAQALEGLSLLVVEDEAATQFLLTEALALVGARVTVSTTCQSAMALLEAQRFDVILSNIVLPDGSGYTLLHQWREWERDHDLTLTPAVAVTAAVTKVSRVKARAAGFQSFVPKPYEFEQLFSAIATAVGTAHHSQYSTDVRPGHDAA